MVAFPLERTSKEENKYEFEVTATRIQRILLEASQSSKIRNHKAGVLFLLLLPLRVIKRDKYRFVLKAT